MLLFIVIPMRDSNDYKVFHPGILAARVLPSRVAICIPRIACFHA